MERLRIEYGTGYMELIVEAFFPCKMPTMRKAARLINLYCSPQGALREPQREAPQEV